MRIVSATSGTKRNAIAEARRLLGLSKANGEVVLEDVQEPGLARFTFKSGDALEWSWALRSPVIIHGIF